MGLVSRSYRVTENWRQECGFAVPRPWFPNKDMGESDSFSCANSFENLDRPSNPSALAIRCRIIMHSELPVFNSALSRIECSLSPILDPPRVPLLLVPASSHQSCTQPSPEPPPPRRSPWLLKARLPHPLHPLSLNHAAPSTLPSLPPPLVPRARRSARAQSMPVTSVADRRRRYVASVLSIGLCLIVIQCAVRWREAPLSTVLHKRHPVHVHPAQEQELVRLHRPRGRSCGWTHSRRVHLPQL